MPNSGASTIAGAVKATITRPIRASSTARSAASTGSTGYRSVAPLTAAMLVPNAIASGPLGQFRAVGGKQKVLVHEDASTPDNDRNA